MSVYFLLLLLNWDIRSFNALIKQDKKFTICNDLKKKKKVKKKLISENAPYLFKMIEMDGVELRYAYYFWQKIMYEQ